MGALLDAIRTIQREGYFIDAKQGMLRHPAVAIAMSVGVELRRWAQEFGFTPAPQQRVPAPPLRLNDDDFDALQ